MATQLTMMVGAWEASSIHHQPSGPSLPFVPHPALPPDLPSNPFCENETRSEEGQPDDQEAREADREAYREKRVEAEIDVDQGGHGRCPGHPGQGSQRVGPEQAEEGRGEREPRRPVDVYVGSHLLPRYQEDGARRRRARARRRRGRAPWRSAGCPRSPPRSGRGGASGLPRRRSARRAARAGPA